MKSKLVWLALGFACACLFVQARGAGDGKGTSATVIDLARPGDALIIKLEGKTVGGLRVDAEGRLGIFGANQNSTAVTIDRMDRIQINPQPMKDPPARLTIADDTWLTGVLRGGRPDAFGDAPFDPNGAIQVGRNLPKAQPMALFRAFAQGKEAFRFGATRDGYGYWSDGPHDSPLITFQPSLAGQERSGKLRFYETELLNDRGTIKGQHPKSRRMTDIVPQ